MDGHTSASVDAMRGWLIRNALIFLVVWFAWVPAGFAVSDAPTRTHDYEHLLRHAETFYWLGMAEGGNLRAFNQGLKYLELAREGVFGANLDERSGASVLIRLDALEQDLLGQIDLAHDTLQGVFPLLMTVQVLRISNSIGFTTFELVDDRSRCNGGHTCCGKASE